MTQATISQRDKTFRNAQRDGDNLCGSHRDMPVWIGSHLEVRAVALAARYGTSAAWTRFYTGATDGTWELLRVQSRTDCRTHYLVTYSPRTDTILGCDCPATGPCWHRGSARLWVEQRKVRAALAERAAWMEA